MFPDIKNYHSGKLREKSDKILKEVQLLKNQVIKFRIKVKKSDLTQKQYLEAKMDEETDYNKILKLKKEELEVE